MEYYIHNVTDGIPGPSPETFSSREAAEAFLDRWRAAMQNIQGYYMPACGERIPVGEVQFEITEVDEEYESLPDVEPF